MKTRLQRWPGNSTLGFSPPMLALSLLLTALPAGAATSFTTTNWVAGVPVPGIQCTNALGQVYLKGNVHVHRVVSAEARIAGRLQAWMDLAYQTDGTAIFSGPAYSEVGTWDGTTFTPSGGVWDMKYSGVAQTDGSDQIHLVGYGIGGAIDGLRVELTATKGPGAPFDPTVPYVSSGTIKPAPVNIRTVVDNFDDNHFYTNKWTATGAGSGNFSVTEANQQLTFGGMWNTPTYYLIDHTAWVWTTPGWSAANGRTVELRADLVSLNSTSAAAALSLYHATGQGYGLSKAGNWVALWKENGNTMTIFRSDQVTTSNTNVVLVFALTSVGQDVVLTGKVLDQSGTVLCQQSYVDTPAADSALSPTEVAQVNGWRVLHDLGPDSVGAPWKDGTAVMLAVSQDTDGTLPAATVTFDNVELRTCEVPPVGIQRAVRLTWPDTGTNYLFEAAPTVLGPWLPFQDSVLPGMQQMTAPANDIMKFFRLRQAP